MNQNEIPVFFAIDDLYAPYLSVALHSAIQNASPLRSYRAIVLYKELNEENRARIKRQETDFFAIDFVPMKNKLEVITDHISNRLRCDYFTLTIYFRLFIPAMFAQYDRAIYIDSDIVLKGDLAELFDTDIGDNYIAGCVESSVADVPELTAYMANAVGVVSAEYINSGVLLMDLKKLRDLSLDTHFLHLLSTYHFDSVAPDQDYINAMCKGKIYYLDQRWNITPNPNHPAVDDPKLIHYNLFSKPWLYDEVQYEDDFWKVAEQTDYYDAIKAQKAAYSKAQKQSDADCLALMIRRGIEIPEKEITFRKMHEKGVKIRL